MIQRFCAAFALSLLVALSGFSEEVISLWGTGDSWTAISQDGNKFYLQDPRGKRGPYERIFPMETDDPSVQPAAYGDVKKQGKFLFSADGERFGPFYMVDHVLEGPGKSIFMTGNKTAEMDAAKEGRLTAFVFDGNRLRVVGQMRDMYNWLYNPDRTGIFGYCARAERAPALLVDSSYLPVDADSVQLLGYLGEKRIPHALVQLAGNKHKTLFEFPSRPDGSIETRVYSYIVQQTGGAGNDKTWGTSDNKSGVYLKLLTSAGTFIFTGYDAFGPYSGDEAWLKAEDGALSPDGKTAVFAFPKNGALWIRFPEGEAGPFDSIVDKPWFFDEGGLHAMALAVKDGKTFAVLDGTVVGGPWDEAAPILQDDYLLYGNSKRARLTGALGVREGTEYFLYRAGRNVAGPFDGRPIGITEANGALSVKLERVPPAGENTSVTLNREDSKWFSVNGKESARYQSAGIPRFSTDGKSMGFPCAKGTYTANEAYLTVDGKEYGPYESVGLPVFVEGGFMYIFKKGGWYLRKSDGSTAAITDRSPFKGIHQDFGVYEGGRVITYKVTVIIKKGEYDETVWATRVMVDGKTHVGYYEASTGKIFVWDAKGKTRKELELK